MVATEKINGLRAEAAEYKQVFLDFVDDTKAKKPTKGKGKKGKKGKKGGKVKKVEENNSEEYEKVDVSHQLYPTKASLGMYFCIFISFSSSLSCFDSNSNYSVVSVALGQAMAR